MTMKLISFDEKLQTFTLKTKVSKGTYIRSLIRDIGKELKTDAVVKILKRTKIGNLEMKNNANCEKIDNLDILFTLPILNITKSELEKILKEKKFSSNLNNNKIERAIFSYNREVVGWAKQKNDKFEFEKILFNRIEKILQRGK